MPNDTLSQPSFKSHHKEETSIVFSVQMFRLSAALRIYIVSTAYMRGLVL